MTTEQKIDIALWLIMLIFLGLSYHSGIALEAQNQRYEEMLQKCEKYPLFEKAVSRIGDRAYDAELYNCVDFSRDLVEELEDIGIKSNIAIGKGREHAWAMVWVEATTGELIDPDKDLEILELRDKNMRVICK